MDQSGYFAFTETTTIHVVEAFDESTDTIVAESDDVFEANEVFEATLIPSERRGYVDIQFGDGSIAYCVNIKALRNVKKG